LYSIDFNLFVITSFSPRILEQPAKKYLQQRSKVRRRHSLETIIVMNPVGRNRYRKKVDLRMAGGKIMANAEKISTDKKVPF
jgi:hypothetical protein